MLAFNTGTWCHITPSDSGTWPNILALIIFTIAPYRPVICFGWILVVIVPPPANAGVRRHQDTGQAFGVTLACRSGAAPWSSERGRSLEIGAGRSLRRCTGLAAQRAMVASAPPVEVRERVTSWKRPGWPRTAWLRA